MLAPGETEEIGDGIGRPDRLREVAGIGPREPAVLTGARSEKRRRFGNRGSLLKLVALHQIL